MEMVLSHLELDGEEEKSEKNRKDEISQNGKDREDIEKNDKGEKKNVAVREKRNHSDVPTKKVVLKKRKNEDENSKKHLEKTKRTRMNTLWSPSRKNRFGRPRKGTVGLHSRLGKGVRKDRVKDYDQMEVNVNETGDLGTLEGVGNMGQKERKKVWKKQKV